MAANRGQTAHATIQSVPTATEMASLQDNGMNQCEFWQSGSCWFGAQEELLVQGPMVVPTFVMEMRPAIFQEFWAMDFDTAGFGVTQGATTSSEMLGAELDSATNGIATWTCSQPGVEPKSLPAEFVLPCSIKNTFIETEETESEGGDSMRHRGRSTQAREQRSRSLPASGR